jgi:hypothetical protein
MMQAPSMEVGKAGTWATGPIAVIGLIEGLQTALPVSPARLRPGARVDRIPIVVASVASDVDCVWFRIISPPLPFRLAGLNGTKPPKEDAREYSN